MDGAGTQRPQAGYVFFSAITLVPRQAISGVLTIQLHHHAVSGYFGHDRGAGDGYTQPVTTDYGFLRQRKTGHPPAVDEQELGCQRKPFHSALHGQPSGLQYPLPVDVLRRYYPHSYSHNVLKNQARQDFSLSGQKLFAIPYPFRPWKVPPKGKYHRRGYHRPG